MSAQFQSLQPSSREGLLALARSRGLLSPLDQQFSQRLAALYDESSESVLWALAIASRQEAAGHVCADLHRLESAGLSTETAEGTETYSVLAATDSLSGWLEEIRASALFEAIPPGTRGATQARPLVVDERGRLYLLRSYDSQVGLAESIRTRAARPDLEVDWALAEAGIDRLSEATAKGDERPALALRTALSRPLSIIAGGPGTGKTTLVARLVALLVEQARAAGVERPRVRLMAPTGKAAAAMTSSFSHQRETLDILPEVRAAMDIDAGTIHRALIKQTRRDIMGRAGRLEFGEDIVIVDESSMVDLELMARLFEACRSVDRVVLLGDPFQLASVDAGAVLSEICLRGHPEGERSEGPPASERADGLAASIVTLRTSHRFSAGGGIGRLAEAVRVGDAEGALELLADPELPEVTRCEIESIHEVRSRLVEASRRVHREIERAADPAEKLARMGLYRVLCAHRRGPLGVEALCTILDETAAAERQTSRSADWWVGRMLLVTKNSPDQNLWNGDVGLIEETGAGLRALFPDGTGGVRALSWGRVPTHESAIAMSVHKSQGSEFEEVDLVLGNVTSRIMTRELLYTGITRARNRLCIHATQDVLRDAIGRRVARDSGLAEMLWAD